MVLHPLTLWLQQLPNKQKWGLALIILFMVLMTSGISWWVLSPSYAVLFTQLDEQDATHIIGQLESNTIPYQLRHDGQDILIDKALIAKTRLKIMASGLQLSGQVGFELFDKNDFGMTDFSQKINYQRALQGELERTIISLEEIRQARVHLVIPEHRLFAQDSHPPKAAVTLHLKAPLTAKQVRSIQQLLSASVPHLRIKNVLVVDHNGNTLSANEEDKHLSQLHNKKIMERYLTNKVQHMLVKVFNEHDIAVKVDVLLNYDEVQRELIKPQNSGVITHEKTIEHAIQDKNAKDKTKQDITSEKSYQLGSAKESFKRARGTIERLSISVVLPQHTQAELLEQVRSLVKNTVGFNEQRGDKISVEALIANPPPNNELSILPAISSTLNPSSAHYNALFFYCFVSLLCLSIPGCILLRQKKLHRRKKVLLELTQWLEHHG